MWFFYLRTVSVLKGKTVKGECLKGLYFNENVLDFTRTDLERRPVVTLSGVEMSSAIDFSDTQKIKRN